MAVLDRQLGVLRELEIRFVHEGGRLERAVPVPQELAVSHGAQLLIHERHQLLDRIALTVPPRRQQSRNSRRVSCHGWHVQAILTRVS